MNFLSSEKLRPPKCGVSEEFVDKMFHLIHEESVRIQLEQKRSHKNANFR